MTDVQTIHRRLAERPLLLSGGLGSELARRGVATPLPLWSTAALLNAPEEVVELHADYVRAGARLVTANTFRTGRGTLGPQGHDARRLTRLAVELARAGIAEAGVEERVLLAGSLGPVADCYRPDLVPGDAVLRAEHGLHVGALVRAGVDLVLVETMNTIAEALAALGAARAGLLPAMVSFVLGPDGHLLSGEPLDDALQAVAPFEPLGVLVNCCAPSVATAAMPRLAGATTQSFGAYANGRGCADDVVGWRFDGGTADDEYAAEAIEWLRLGARIVGGCCGTAPSTIRRLAQHLARS